MASVPSVPSVGFDPELWQSRWWLWSAFVMLVSTIVTTAGVLLSLVHYGRSVEARFHGECGYDERFDNLQLLQGP